MIASQKHPAKSKVITLVLVGLLIAVGVGLFVVYRNNAQALADAARTKSTDKDKVEPVFSFLGSGEWRQGPTNGTSMALFSAASPDDTSVCFTSIEHYTGTIDPAVALQKNRDIQTSGGQSITPLGTQVLTLQTTSGERQYELYQSKITTPSGALKIMEGNELGYLQLSDGYIKILGNCNTAEELPLTLPALSAIKYTGKL